MIQTRNNKERKELVIQYEPLINKITAQFYGKVCCDWKTIKSMAYEGFVLAINKYDNERSKMSFMSFAAFEMRNNIMTRLTEESRTVKLPFEAQKKIKDNGQSTWITVSIDRRNDDEDGPSPKEMIMNMYEAAKFDDGDVYEYLYQRIEERFPERDCQMFYMSYGLKGCEEVANQDIAKMFQVSEGLISQKKKKIIEFIRQDTELCEMLANLL